MAVTINNPLQLIYLFAIYIWYVVASFISNLPELPKRIAIDIETKLTSTAFQVTDIVFDPYTDEIEFDIVPLKIGINNIDTSKVELVFSKSLFGFFTDPKLSIREIRSTKSKHRYRADIKGIPSGHYWLRLENIPEQNGKIVNKYIFVRKPAIEISLSSNKPLNLQIGDNFVLALSIKNLSPFAGDNIKIITFCDVARLKSISLETVKKEESQYNTKLIVEEIKPKEELIINLNYYAQAYTTKLTCEAYLEAYPIDYKLRKYQTSNAKPAPINIKVDARKLKKEPSTLEDLASQLTEARWNYCRAKNSSKDLVEQCSRIMAKKDFECLRKDKTLFEAKACARNIYGSLPPV